MRALAVVAMLLCSCGGGGSGSCVEGTSAACTCTNGLGGAQVCGPDGTFGPCVCEGTVDAGSEDGAAPDASPADAAPVGAGVILVLDISDTAIRVFDRLADGDVAPVRMVRGGNTLLAGPVAIHVDAVNEEIVAANADDDSLTVYPLGASGNAAPARRIAGASTGLAIAPTGDTNSHNAGLFIDPVHDEIVIPCTQDSSAGCVQVFARTANGDVPPLRVISGPSTTLHMLGMGSLIEGVTVDLVNDEIVLADTAGGGSVRVFARAASGDAPPVRTLMLPFSEYYHDADVDAVNGELWLTQGSSFMIFARTASGTASPLRTFPHPGATHPTTFLDVARGEVIVAAGAVIATFDLAGTLLRQIEGPATGVGSTWSVTAAP